MVRGCDGKSPLEAVEFILQLFKYNDNSGNPYSDVYWLAALVESIGKIEFGPRSIQTLPPLLKRIDQLLQFDRLMPSYNGVLTVSCIRCLTHLVLKFSHCVPLEHFENLIKPLQDSKMQWNVRLEAMKASIDLEAHKNGLDVALSSALRFIEEDPSLRVQSKLFMHCLQLCQIKSNFENIKCCSLAGLLHLLQSRKAFANVTLRHYTFCILQILAGRSATLFGIPKPKILPSSVLLNEQKAKSASVKIRLLKPQESDGQQILFNSDALNSSEAVREVGPTLSCSSGGNEHKLHAVKLRIKHSEAADDVGNFTDTTRGGGLDHKAPAVCTVTSSSMSVDAGFGVDKAFERSQCSPGDDAVEIITVQESAEKTKETAYSLHANGSQLNVSAGSTKNLIKDGTANDLHCTADSRNAVYVQNCFLSTVKSKYKSGGRFRDVDALQHNSFVSPVAEEHYTCRSEENGSLQNDLQNNQHIEESSNLVAEASAVNAEKKEKVGKGPKDKQEKKDKKRKREKDNHHKHDKHNDPEYIARKRQKKEKKRQEKERLRLQKMMMSKELSADLQKPECSTIQRRLEPTEVNSLQRISETVETSSVQSRFETAEASSGQRISENTETTSAHKIRIKIKNKRNLNC